MKDIQPYYEHHDPVVVNYLAIGGELNKNGSGGAVEHFALWLRQAEDPLLFYILNFGKSQSFRILNFGKSQSFCILNFGKSQSFRILNFGKSQSFRILNFGKSQSFHILYFGTFVPLSRAPFYIPARPYKRIKGSLAFLYIWPKKRFNFPFLKVKKVPLSGDASYCSLLLVAMIVRDVFLRCITTLHTNITLSFHSFPDLHPCINVRCNYYAYCQAYGPKDARCVCQTTCPSYEDLVCADNGQTYQNMCYFELFVCQNRASVGVLRKGSCVRKYYSIIAQPNWHGWSRVGQESRCPPFMGRLVYNCLQISRERIHTHCHYSPNTLHIHHSICICYV